MKTILVIIMLAANGSPIVTIHEFGDEMACQLASVQIMEQMEKISGQRIEEDFNIGCVDHELKSLKE